MNGDRAQGSAVSIVVTMVVVVTVFMVGFSTIDAVSEAAIEDEETPETEPFDTKAVAQTIEALIATLTGLIASVTLGGGFVNGAAEVVAARRFALEP